MQRCLEVSFPRYPDSFTCPVTPDMKTSYTNVKPSASVDLIDYSEYLCGVNDLRIEFTKNRCHLIEQASRYPDLIPGRKVPSRFDAPCR